MSCLPSDGLPVPVNGSGPGEANEQLRRTLLTYLQAPVGRIEWEAAASRWVLYPPAPAASPPPTKP